MRSAAPAATRNCHRRLPSFVTRRAVHQRVGPIKSSSTELDFEILADLAEADILVRLRRSQLGYGLVATEAVSRSNTIDIPIESTLTVADRECQFFQSFIRKWQQLHGELPPELYEFLAGPQPPEMRLAGWLLWLRSRGGDMWQQYCKLLPHVDQLTCLMCFSREEADELQLQPLKDEAEEQRDWVKEVHLRLWHPETGELRALRLVPSFLDTLWAVAVVKSRSVTLRVDGAQVVMQTPVADFVNHSFDPSCEFLLNEDGSRFLVSPLRAIEEGEEVTVAYAPAATNFDLMRDFGFLVPANPYEIIQLPETTDGPRRLDGRLLRAAFQLKGRFMDASICPVTAPSSSNNTDPEAFPEMDWLRMRSALLSLPVDDFGGAVMTEDLFNRPELKRQRQAATALKNNVAASLEALPTSVATDEKLLINWSSLRLSSRQRQAVLCRLEYKYLLSIVCEVLEQYVAFLQRAESTIAAM